jgi:hypothetical protein
LSLRRVEVVVAGESRVVVGAEIDGVMEKDKEKEEAELTLLASPHQPALETQPTEPLVAVASYCVLVHSEVKPIRDGENAIDMP